MKTKHSLQLFLLFLVTFPVLSFCQNKKTTDEEFIKSFFEDVFSNQKPSEILYMKYVYVNLKNEQSTYQKILIFDEHISDLRSNKKHLTAPDVSFTVENYKDSSIQNLVPFDKSEAENIFVVIVDNVVESYVLLTKGKIESFNYTQEESGGPASFITAFN